MAELGLNGEPLPTATELAAEQKRWGAWADKNWPLPKAAGKHCQGCGKRLRVYDWCPPCLRAENRRLMAKP
jgi:hypothetical protein